MRVTLTMVQVFKNMDKDGSGTVSKDEFLKICKNLSKEQVDAHFKRTRGSSENQASALDPGLGSVHCSVSGRREKAWFATLGSKETF